MRALVPLPGRAQACSHTSGRSVPAAAAVGRPRQRCRSRCIKTQAVASFYAPTHVHGTASTSGRENASSSSSNNSIHFDVNDRLEAARHWTKVRDTFQAFRTQLDAGLVLDIWDRLAKLAGQDDSPELQRFVNVLACNSSDRMQEFGPAGLARLICVASRLGRNNRNGMFRAFLASWAEESALLLPQMSIKQMDVALAAVLRLTWWKPPPLWVVEYEREVAAKLPICQDAATVAHLLVSLVSLSTAPSPVLKQTCRQQLQRAFFFSLSAAAAETAAATAATAEGAAAVGAAAGAARRAHGGGACYCCSSTTCRPTGPPPPAEARRLGSLARPACSALWAAACLDLDLPAETTSALFNMACLGREQLHPADYAHLFGAVSKVHLAPSQDQVTSLLEACTARMRAEPFPVFVLSTMLLALADARVRPTDAWLAEAHRTLGPQEAAKASAETVHAVLHSAAVLDLPSEPWITPMVKRLEQCDLTRLSDKALSDVVQAFSRLHAHPPTLVLKRLRQEAQRRLVGIEVKLGAGSVAAASATQHATPVPQH